MKKISPLALTALKDALTSIYWTKRDLISFIENSIQHQSMVATIDWQNQVKYESVSQLIDRMASHPEIYQTDLLNLINYTSSITNFDHLKRWDDAQDKIIKAKSAVQSLKSQTGGYFEALKEQESIAEKRQQHNANINASSDFQKKLSELRESFFQLTKNISPQERGFGLEKFLNALFELFDLQPKQSYRILGEQIDGAFSYEGTDYLLEAKWQSNLINLSDLYSFAGKIDSKLKNTLGLYFSMNGFSDNVVKEKSNIKNMLLFDGLDMMQVLEGRISLTDILLQKKRHASQTGEIMYRVNGF